MSKFKVPSFIRLKTLVRSTCTTLVFLGIGLLSPYCFADIVDGTNGLTSLSSKIQSTVDLLRRAPRLSDDRHLAFNSLPVQRFIEQLPPSAIVLSVSNRPDIANELYKLISVLLKSPAGRDLCTALLHTKSVSISYSSIDYETVCGSKGSSWSATERGAGLKYKPGDVLFDVTTNFPTSPALSRLLPNIYFIFTTEIEKSFSWTGANHSIFVINPNSSEEISLFDFVAHELYQLVDIKNRLASKDFDSEFWEKRLYLEQGDFDRCDFQTAIQNREIRLLTSHVRASQFESKLKQKRYSIDASIFEIVRPKLPGLRPFATYIPFIEQLKYFTFLLPTTKIERDRLRNCAVKEISAEEAYFILRNWPTRFNGRTVLEVLMHPEMFDSYDFGRLDDEGGPRTTPGVP